MRPEWLSKRSRGLAATGFAVLLAALVLSTQWLLTRTGESDGAGIANVLALPATVIGTVVTFLGWWSRPRSDDPAALKAQAQHLLSAVVVAEERVLQQLLGDIGKPRSADVGFGRPDAAASHWRCDGGDPTGSLATIADYYKTLGRGRLVVLGDAGAGKTVLAVQLLVDMATAEYKRVQQETTSRVRVPVRLNLSAFVPPDEVASPAAVRQKLDAWVSAFLVEVYGIMPAVADALVYGGWILPIFDGLDEMDPDEGEPQRARQVMAALNLPSGPSRWPVVLTCRTTRFQHLVQPGASRSGGPLQDATVIALRPLDVDQVVAWLAHRFPGPGQPDHIQRRWRRVITTLRRHPHGRLAACLTSPLRLYLAASVYRAPDTAPHELCDLSRDELESHLLRHLIPAITARRLGEKERTYDPMDAERWLRTFADHLAEMGALGRSTTDIHLHDLWRTTGAGASPGRRVRYQATTAAIGMFALPLLAFALWYIARAGDHQPVTAIGLQLVFVSLVAVALVARRTSSPDPPPPRRLTLRSVGTARGLRQLATSFIDGFVVGLPAALTVGLAVGLVLAMAFQRVGSPIIGVISAPIAAWSFAIANGLHHGLSSPQSATTKPSDAMRQGLIWVIVFRLTHSLLFWLPLAFIFGLAFRNELTWLALGLAASLSPALIGILTETVTLRYYLAIRDFSRTSALPQHPGQFLDWAHDVGLVRLSGTATQFRHRDLQMHLTTTPTAGLVVEQVS